MPVQQEDPKGSAHGWRRSWGLLVVLATPLNAQSWLAARLDKIGEGPCAFLLRQIKTRRKTRSPTASSP